MLCNVKCTACTVWTTFSGSILCKSVKLTEPPDAEPHVRWCERSAAKAASYSISQKEVVSKAKDRYENELDKLEKLMQKRDELHSKELMEAFARSERSFEEVMRFLSGNEVDDE